MTLVNNRLLPAILALLVATFGYAWITLLVEDRAPDVTPEPIAAAEASSDRQSEQQPDTTVAAQQNRSSKEPLRPISNSDRLVGRVVDSNGRGLAGIMIRIRTLREFNREFILRQALTDDDGGFVLDDLDPLGSYLLFTEAHADYPAYRRDGFTLDMAPEPFEIRLQRLDLVDIEGTVVDVEHVPVADFTLTVESLGSNYPSRVVTSDASGYFRLDAFPVGELKIYTATPEYFRILGLSARADEYPSLSLVIDRGRYRLTGFIVDERDMPVASERITLKSLIDGGEYRSQASRTGHSDTSGYFEFSGLGGIAHTLGVYANGYKPHIEYHQFQSFADHLEIRLRR
ncbi:MAG: carboxypeptidase-like regulatory domain-containing protein [Gammaproteobacteria bacterium]|nr:carboxypeptidase-like regulatory domain-containing protein [Gammaproteobacteria bacterium]